MRKTLLFFFALMSFTFAMAQKQNYTSVTLTTTELDLDEDGASIGVLVDGELDAMSQMYAPYGMVTNVMNNAWLYKGEETEGTKVAPVTASWGKPLAIATENLEYGTNYKLVIKVGGISTMSYAVMQDILENKEEITLEFKTKAARTEPFIKSAKANVSNYQTIDVTAPEFNGITLTCVAKNLPTLGAYLVFQGGVRLYEVGKEGYSFCTVSGIAAKDGENVFTIVPKDKLETGKAYKVEIPFEALYVHNYFDMAKEVCYFPPMTVEFYTKHDAPTVDGNYTITLGEEGFTVTSADDNNFFAAAFQKDYITSGKTPEQYFDANYISYGNQANLKKNSETYSYSYYGMSSYSAGTWYICVAGAEYDENQEACYMTTKPVVMQVEVSEEGTVTGIKKVQAASANARIYGIDGVERKTLRKGINIVGGKKIVF